MSASPDVARDFPPGQTANRIHGAGFTLIELLVSITLMSLVSAIVYATFFQVVVSMEESQVAAAELRLRHFLTRSFSANLSQAYGDWRPGAALREPVEEDFDDPDAPRDDREDLFDSREDELVPVIYIFEGIDENGPFGPADSLSFTTTSPLMGRMALPGFLKQVTYEVVGQELDEEEMKFRESAGEDALYNTLESRETHIMVDPAEFDDENPLSDFNTAEFGELAEDLGHESPGWGVPIRTLDFQYFDGEEWVDDWDSVEMGRLPWSVHIRANFARPREELEAESAEGLDPIENPDFDLVVSIPAGMGTLQAPPAYVPDAKRGGSGAVGGGRSNARGSAAGGRNSSRGSGGRDSGMGNRR